MTLTESDGGDDDDAGVPGSSLVVHGSCAVSAPFLDRSAGFIRSFIGDVIGIHRVAS